MKKLTVESLNHPSEVDLVETSSEMNAPAKSQTETEARAEMEKEIRLNWRQFQSTFKSNSDQSIATPTTDNDNDNDNDNETTTSVVSFLSPPPLPPSIKSQSQKKSRRAENAQTATPTWKSNRKLRLCLWKIQQHDGNVSKPNTRSLRHCSDKAHSQSPNNHERNERISYSCSLQKKSGSSEDKDENVYANEEDENDHVPFSRPTLECSKSVGFCHDTTTTTSFKPVKMRSHSCRVGRLAALLRDRHNEKTSQTPDHKRDGNGNQLRKRNVDQPQKYQQLWSFFPFPDKHLDHIASNESPQLYSPVTPPGKFNFSSSIIARKSGEQFHLSDYYQSLLLSQPQHCIQSPPSATERSNTISIPQQQKHRYDFDFKPSFQRVILLKKKKNVFSPFIQFFSGLTTFLTKRLDDDLEYIQNRQSVNMEI
ncbi:hypothetical protein RFI_11627 [Reticulomyxa filosa]|uniref:Uncharacterized protein n=1 Tax=Reticulomyxa filosa TaxID=46433 RepID=X6NHN6_RETFI|nr:hypothetical protein RFI_11627 [Reticulomyxa filosa]|eukprot:ETO25511.1 hypothetical protein RFI_11627 [Reticulomyxa filosa]